MCTCELNAGIRFTSSQLYSWAERGRLRVKCLAQENKTMSTARTRTWTARSGVKCTNHEATARPTALKGTLQMRNVPVICPSDYEMISMYTT